MTQFRNQVRRCVKYLASVLVSIVSYVAWFVRFTWFGEFRSFRSLVFDFDSSVFRISRKVHKHVEATVEFCYDDPTPADLAHNKAIIGILEWADQAAVLVAAESS